MDYETLREINPKLIYASITGYGQTGPYSNRAGYMMAFDVYSPVVRSVTATPTLTGAPSRAPVMCINSQGDLKNTAWTMKRCGKSTPS
jgi:succinate--hydroxymethylglutarate CoA-transferase